MKPQADIEIKNSSNDSRTITVLMTIYMCTVLLFTANAILNVISQVFFVLAFGGCAVYMMMHSKNFRFDPFLLILASFIFFCFIGLTWSRNINRSITMIITLIQLFALSIILFSYISNYNNIDVFIRALLISGVVSSWVVIGYYGFNEFIQLMLEGARLGGPISNENTIGMYASTTVIVAFYYAYFHKKRYMFAIMILPILVTFGSGSRKAFVMIILGIGLLLLMQYRDNISLSGFMKLFAAVVVVILIISVISEMSIFENTFSRMDSLFGDEMGRHDNSTNVREKMIEIGLDYFKQHPYTGVGIGNSNIITLKYLGWSTYLHNNYVEILASVGVFGFLIFYLIYFYLLKNLYTISIKTGDSTAMLMFALILTQLVMEYGMVSYYSKMTYIYFSIAAATVAIGKRNMLEMEEKALEEDFVEDTESN